MKKWFVLFSYMVKRKDNKDSNKDTTKDRKAVTKSNNCCGISIPTGSTTAHANVHVSALAHHKHNVKVTKYRRPIPLTPKQLKNFIDHNTLQDWLELHHPYRDEIAKLASYTRQQRFRDHIQQYLLRQYPDKTQVIPRVDIDTLTSAQQMKKLNGSATVTLMSAGTPIIHNAHLVNRSENICDVADLLVRSDYLTIIFPTLTTRPDSGSTFGSWHYVAIVTDSTYSKEYCQTRLLIQNRILDYYQHYYPKYGVLIDNSVYTPTILDITDSSDTYRDARAWIEQLHVSSEAKGWNITPVPSVNELYANDKIDSVWSPIISEIANKQDDITQLFGGTYKHRAVARRNGVKTIAQAKYPEDLGFKTNNKLVYRVLSQKYNSKADLRSALPELSDTWATLSLSVMDNIVYNDDGSISSRPLVYSATVGTTCYGLSETPELSERAVAEGLYCRLSALKATDPNFQIYYWDDSRLKYLQDKYPEYPLSDTFASNLISVYDTIVNGKILLSGQYNYQLESVARALGMDVSGSPETSNKAAEYWCDLLYNSNTVSTRSMAHERLVKYGRNVNDRLEYIVTANR